jgi:two-component system, chemotaxis family, CheB/CheR fusion protein
MKKGLRARAVAAARPPSSRRKAQSAADRAEQDRKPSKSKAKPLATIDLQHIFSAYGIATLVLDRQLALCFFTPAASALFKVTAADLGRPLSEVGRRFADEDLLLDLQTVIATGVSLWREVETDGGIWYNRRLLPYRIGDKEIQGAVITFADISEMKAVERESEAARNYSSSIVDAIRQPLIVLDHELRVISASPSFYHGFAVMPSEAVGQHLTQLRDRCFDVQALRSFLDRLAAGHPVAEDYEITIELPPRGKRVLLLNARNIPAAPPAKQRTLVAIDDISDRKHSEAALEAAKKQSERANLGKSRFLAAASHDLRQPLQTIFLVQGLLAAKVKDPDTAKLVTRIGESMDAMSDMLNKLLDINQLEAGIIEPTIETFPLAGLFERLRADFAYQAETKFLSCHVVSTRLCVRSDPALLEQMLRNLLSNALKYTERGKILLGCRRRGALLRIEVWDTGRGIPEDQFEAIFEEFHQLDNPARERARGLGLGLSIVQRLAHLLGYPIDLRSQPGKGSVFAIEVPCAARATTELAQTASLLAAPSGATGGSILIVDDDPAIRETLQMLFELEGYRTAAAADGRSAVALVAGGVIRPDIMIADFNLPNEMSGLDVAAQLRATFNPALPVLMVTGDISTETLRAIAAADCVQLNKPIRAHEIIRLVHAQLAAPARSAEQPRKPTVVAAATGLAATVFLIDDDVALRETMGELIGQEGRPVETFASCEAFLAAYRPNRKGCLLVDARLPGLGGIALLQQLKAEQRELPSIVITGHGDVSMAVEAMKAGAIDFIEKPVRRDELLASIDRALALSQDSSALSGRREAAVALIARLTPREREVMGLVIAGQPNKIIAADMHVSQRTVENHRAAVMKKTRSKSLSDLVRLSIAAI